MKNDLKRVLSKSVKYYSNKIKTNYPSFSFTKNNKVILFGAAELGKIYIDLCKKNKIEILALCDNDISKKGKKVKNIRIIAPYDLSGYSKKTGFIVTSIHEDAIKLQLKNLGFNNIWPHYYFSILYPKKFYNPHWISSIDPIIKNKDKIINCFELLCDLQSKKTLLNVIKYRLLLNKKYIDAIKKSIKEEYYDNKIVKFTNKEIFIDGGAYNGDTLIKFKKLINNNFIHIYAFEPDSFLFDQLKITHNSMNDSRITILNYALGDKKNKLKFTNDGSPGSRLSKRGKLLVDVVTLDNILSKIPVTMIKLDIEGAETKALLGSKELIKKHRPKLAICIYHNPSDLWEIPIFIKSLLPDYKLYIRHYGDYIYDTICYAI